MGYCYEDDGIGEEKLKQDYHYAIDEIIEKVVEEKLKQRVEDLSEIREEQKRYGEHLEKLTIEKKEAQKKEREALREAERTKEQCEEKINEIRKQSFESIFGKFIDEKGRKKNIYFLETSKLSEPCPYCNNTGTLAKKIDGLIGEFDCPICKRKKI